MSISTIRNDIKNQRKAEDESSSYLANLARSGLGQGVALGFGDEIEAGVGATYDKFVKGKDFTDSYGTRVKNVRNINERFKETNPISAYGSEIVGTIATGAAAVPKLLAKGASKLGSKGVQKVAANQYVAPTVTSGIYGAGIGEDNINNRLTNAAILAAASPVLQKGMNVIAPKIGTAGSRLLKKGIQPTAPQILSEGATTGGYISGGIGKISQAAPYLGKVLENVATSLPGVSLGMGAIKTNTLAQYNFALVDDALSAIGKKIPRKQSMSKGFGKIVDPIFGTNIKSGPNALGGVKYGNKDTTNIIKDVVEEAKEIINQERVNIIGSNKVAGKIDFNKATHINIQNRINNILKESQNLGIVPDAQLKLNKQVNKVLDMWQKKGKGGTSYITSLSGKNFAKGFSELTNLKKKLNKIDPDAGDVIDDILNSMLEKLPPSVAKEFKNTNKAYARITPIEEAVDRSKFQVFTPSMFENAVKNQRPKGQRRNYNQFATQITDDMRQVIGSAIDNPPDSGTGSRLFLLGDDVAKNVAESAAATIAGLSYGNPLTQTTLRNLPKLSTTIAQSPVSISAARNKFLEEEDKKNKSRSGLLK